MLIRHAALLATLTLLAGTTVALAGGAITWTPTAGPPGASIYALVPVPGAPEILFAGTNGGVYVTRDGGAHWEHTSNGLPDDPTVSALAISPDSSIAFAGTRSGVYVSRDAGAHWAPADRRISSQMVLSLFIPSSHPASIYAGTSTTVLKSDDVGNTWSEIGQDLAFPVMSLAAPPDGSTLYVAGDKGVFASNDRGAHWQPASDGLPSGARPQHLTISPRGFFLATMLGLYRSRDGKAWTAVEGVVANTPVRLVHDDVARPDRVLAITPQGAVISTDGGTTFALLPSTPKDTPILSLALGDRNAIYFGTAHGVWKTNDQGATWQFLATGLSSSTVHTLLRAPTSSGTVFAASPSGLWLRQDSGGSWRAAHGFGDAPVLALAADANSRVIYAATEDGALYSSNDDGLYFARVIKSVADRAPVSSLAVLRSGQQTTLYAGTAGRGVVKSGDGGRTWTATAGALGAARVTTLAFVSSKLYAGTEQGLFWSDRPDQPEWSPVSSDLPEEPVRSIIAGIGSAQQVYVLFAGQGVYRSDDAGAHWRKLGRGALPTPLDLQALAANPAEPSVLYLGTARGLYRTDDGGATWRLTHDGPDRPPDVRAILVDPDSPSRILIGTGDHGVLSGTDSLGAVELPWSGIELPWSDLSAAGLAAVALVSAGALAWRMRLSPAARERRWAKNWPTFEPAITNALWTFGQANEVHLNQFPRRPLAVALQRYAALYEDERLTLEESPLALKLDSYIPAQKFFGLWKAASEIGDGDKAQSVTRQMVDQLCKLLGLTFVEERTYNGLTGCVVQAPALRIKVPSRFPVLFVSPHTLSEDPAGALRGWMHLLGLASYFGLVFDLSAPPDVEGTSALKSLASAGVRDFVVLDGADVRRLFAARDASRELVRIILDQIDLAMVSPYVTNGPVPDNMFFGREYELKTILQSIRTTSFAVVGGRQIGKTSLLTHVYRHLEAAGGFRPFYLDCQAIRSDVDFYAAIESFLTVRLPSHTPDGFGRMVLELAASYPSQTLVILLDEIDAVLGYDMMKGEPLFRVLRSLAQDARVRFVLGGERVLNLSLHDPQRVLFNFGQVLRLTYLPYAQARRIVIEPLQEMGVALEDDDALADEIVAWTAGHPNLLQYLCQKLIERMDRQRARTITHTDVAALGQSTPFTEYWTALSWGMANSFEQLLILLMLDKKETTARAMADLLRRRHVKVSPAEVETAFQALDLYSIVYRKGHRYAFTAPVLPTVLRRCLDTNQQIAELVYEIRRNRGEDV